jgi:predicted  nucleic acid-binding Zn-ribbon protein
MDINYSRPPETRLDREEIARSTDVQELRYQLAELEVLNDEVTASVETRALGGLDTDRAVSKLFFIRVATSWVTRRLRQIEPVEDQPYVARLKGEIAKLNAQNTVLREQLNAARAATEAKILRTVVFAAGGRVVISQQHAADAADTELRLTEDRATDCMVYTTEECVA